MRAEEGIPLWRTPLPNARLDQSIWTHAEPTTDVPHEDGRWFPEARAAALLEVVATARAYRDAAEAWALEDSRLLRSERDAAWVRMRSAIDLLGVLA